MEEYEPTKADAYRRTIQLQGDEVQIDILGSDYLNDVIELKISLFINK